MTIKEIPRSFEYTCDRCGSMHLQENAAGHYPDSTPNDWSKLYFKYKIERNEKYVYYNLLLCTPCSEMFHQWIKTNAKAQPN